MHEKVQEYLAMKNAEKNKNREEFLLNEEICEKEYSPDNKESFEYSNREWSDKEHKYKYYKKIPIKITDEEYEMILKAQTDDDKASNPIATALKIISVIIFIGGFILGIVLGTQEVEQGIYYTYTKTEFSFAIALIYWAVSFISGMLMLGFSEIINLLNSIKNK